jgi:cytosine/adenosine deaminase-related metal-dependent hydrolase
MTTLISSVFTLQGEALETLDILINNHTIEAVAPAGSLSTDGHEAVIFGENKLLLPGFVNGHTHSYQVWQRGLIPQLPLELWLADLIDSSPQQLDQYYWGAVSTAVDTLLSGGTCIMDHCYVAPGQEHDIVDTLVRGYKAVGIRAVIAPMIQDMPFVMGLPGGCTLPHEPSTEKASDILAMMASLVEKFHEPEAGIYIGMGPTGFHRCSDELLQGCEDISRRYDLCYHTHLLETRAQKRLAYERYGTSAVKHLQSLGCLTPRTSIAHGVWIEEDDLNVLAETGTTLVHNPVSNLRLGSGLAPILKGRDAGVNIALGCDGAASNDAQNMLETIKLGTILHTVNDLDYQKWLTPGATLRMATAGGAKGVNLATSTGTIAPGMEADLVLYDLDHPSMLPHTNPLQLLVLGHPTEVVESVWIRGRQLVRQGQIQTIDVSDLYEALRKQPIRKEAINRQTIQKIEPHYRNTIQTA